MRPELKGRDADKAIEVSNKIAPMLAGLPPAVQSAIVADLAARWLAGWAPDVRQAVYQEHIALILCLVDVNEKMIFGEAGHPGGRH